MSPQAFLAELRRQEIQVWADGDRLHCSAPTGLLTPELREQIQKRKSEILVFLATAKALADQQRAIVPLQPRGLRTSIYAVPGHNGDVFAYRTLARLLGEDQPLFGLEPPGLDDHSQPLVRVEALAHYFATQIRQFQPEGPYIIAGYCAGGSVAFELARQLQESGATISFLALFACPFPTFYYSGAQLTHQLRQQVARFATHVRALTTLSSQNRNIYIAEKLRSRKARRDAHDLAALDPVLAVRTKVGRATITAVRHYTPRSFAGRVGLFLPNREWLRSGTAPLRWRTLSGRSEEFFGPDDCNPDLLLLEPDAPAIAKLFLQFRDSCDEEANSINAWSNRTKNAAGAGGAPKPIIAAREISGSMNGAYK
ncbi:MAG: thioesterase [Prolixibacteraceae bacterium]|nr:thioesterase [Burkholderiales bacterium]